jgi:hypothetical protein
MTRIVWRFSIGLLTVLLTASTAHSEACEPDDIQGLYEGAYHSAELGDIEITLNLLCNDNAYAAQIFTPLGDLSVKGASSKGAHVQVEFVAFGVPSTLALDLKGNELSGPAVIATRPGDVVLKRMGSALAADGMRPRLELSPEMWREDVAALGSELSTRHANAFFHIKRDQFEAEISRIQADAAHLNGDQVFARLSQIAESIGDGHTNIGFPPDRGDLPLAIGKFGKDFRIVGAGLGLEAANGARIVKIDGTPIEEAYRLVMTLTPSGELPELRESRAVDLLTRGIVLHGLGITGSRDHAAFLLHHDQGKDFSLGVDALGPNQSARLTPAYSRSGLRFHNPDVPFWCEHLEAQRAVYCAFRGYADLESKSKDMYALIERTHPKKLIIDMRDNSGGNNTVGDRFLIKPIAALADVNQKGHLYVLVGARTFSAAMNNAAQFQDDTEAVLVGQTIGERPNSYQESRQFRLPNSHLVVRVSTRYYRFRTRGENAVRPDKEIIPPWADAKAGRDPVLDWVLKQ